MVAEKWHPEFGWVAPLLPTPMPETPRHRQHRHFQQRGGFPPVPPSLRGCPHPQNSPQTHSVAAALALTVRRPSHNVASHVTSWPCCSGAAVKPTATEGPRRVMGGSPPTRSVRRRFGGSRGDTRAEALQVTRASLPATVSPSGTIWGGENPAGKDEEGVEVTGRVPGPPPPPPGPVPPHRRGPYGKRGWWWWRYPVAARRKRRSSGAPGSSR